MRSLLFSLLSHVCVILNNFLRDFLGGVAFVPVSAKSLKIFAGVFTSITQDHDKEN